MIATERSSVNPFTPHQPFHAGTAQERKPDRDFINAGFHGQSAPIWTLRTNAKRYKVSKPIKVHIYSEGGVYFAENEALVVVGTGASVQEALEELSGHIIHFYQYYMRLSDDKVTGDAIRLKKIYETLFVRQQ